MARCGGQMTTRDKIGPTLEAAKDLEPKPRGKRKNCTFRQRDLAAAVPVRPTAAHSEVPVPQPRAARVVKRVSLDICARHGMRRVDYGRRWRCRK